MEFEKSLYRDICAFESQLDSICFSSYYTEAEQSNAASDNIFTQLANKIKEIINKIASKLQGFISKILGSSSINEESSKRIEQALQNIKQAASMNANFSKEVNTYLSQQSECYSSAKKYVVVHSAKFTFMTRLIENGINCIKKDPSSKKTTDEIKKLTLASSKLETPADYVLSGVTGGLTIESMFNIHRQKKEAAFTKKSINAGADLSADIIKQGQDMNNPNVKKDVEDVTGIVKNAANKLGDAVVGPIRKVYSVINGAKRLSNIVASIKVNRQAKQQRDTAVNNINLASKQVANITSTATAIGAKLTKAEKEALDHDYKVLIAFVNKFEPKAVDILNKRGDVNAQLEDRKKFAQDQIKTKKDIKREKRQGKFEEA